MLLRCLMIWCYTLNTFFSSLRYTSEALVGGLVGKFGRGSSQISSYKWGWGMKMALKEETLQIGLVVKAQTGMQAVHTL